MSVQCDIALDVIDGDLVVGLISRDTMLPVSEARVSLAFLAKQMREFGTIEPNEEKADAG